MKLTFVLLLIVFAINCTTTEERESTNLTKGVELVVLGIAQDAGFPQAGCEKINCQLYWSGEVDKRHATSLGLIDHNSGEYWLFEATPDFKHQLHEIKQLANTSENPAGIFLTHAHMGHYTGLMHLGREVMGVNKVPVFAMPKMKSYLEENGPWSQLVDLNNISINSLSANSSVPLNSNISVTPFLVPHRDEFSEAVGYKIQTDSTSVLFIPDINKWEIWNRSILEEISKVDYAFLDGTFYNQNELPGRNMSKIPHPFIEESLEIFKDLPDFEKAKIHFIHFNHTNPLILNSPEKKEVEKLGYKITSEGMIINLF